MTSPTSDSESGQGHRSVGCVALCGQGHRLHDDEPHSPVLPMLEEADCEGWPAGFWQLSQKHGPLATVANDAPLPALRGSVPGETQPSPVPLGSFAPQGGFAPPSQETQIDTADAEIDPGDECVFLSRAQVEQDLREMRDTAGRWLAVIPPGRRYDRVTWTVQNLVCACVVALTRGATDMELAAARYGVQALWRDARDMMLQRGFLSYSRTSSLPALSANLGSTEYVLDAINR